MKTFLSPKDLASAIGVSESSLKRWTDDGLLTAARTAGGHRRIALADAVRFIREQRTPVVNPQALGLAELAEVPSWDAPVAERLLAALRDEEPWVGRGLMLAMYLGGTSLASICDGPVRSALQQIGTMWRHGTRGIAIEHRAVDICTHALSMIRSMLPKPEPGAPAALGGGPEGDPYTLPSLMAAIILEEIGYRVFNLGANVPMPVLSQEARHQRASLVWLSVSVELDAEEPSMRRRVESLADELAANAASLVVGGRSAAALSLRARPNLHEVGSMAELASFARGRMQSHSAAGSTAGQ